MNIKHLLMAIVIFSAISACVEAEELLHKGEATYLGWQISKEHFITCNKRNHEIDGGKIVKTAEKCPKDIIPGPVIIGIVKEVNKDAMTFKVRKEDGKVDNFFYPEEFAAKGSASLSDIKAGDTISVLPAAVGNRAESVKLIQSSIHEKGR